VQGAADFERTTLKEVIEARSKATSTTIDASNLTAENMAQFQQAQSGLSSALSRLLVTVERYPDLKANQNFLELQKYLQTLLPISLALMQWHCFLLIQVPKMLLM